jgi:hypothetical protein
VTSSLPAFGPTGSPVSDSDVDGMAVVRLAVVLSRTHLQTALAAGYAEMGEGRALADLDVSEIRREVEGYLGANALIQLYRETDALGARPSSPWLAALDEAITRAYSLPAATVGPSQPPRYGEGTVTLATEDFGDVTLEEPSWCVGHADHRPGVYRCDLTHYGTETVLAYQGAPLFRVMLAESPFATRPEQRAVVAYIEQADHTGDFTATGLYDLAATLDTHADRLRDFADQLDTILGGGDR